MSKEYDDYLKDHISAVQKAGNWMLSYGVIPFNDYETRRTLPYDLGRHDESKYSPDEYDAYDDYFYGKEGKDEEDITVIDSCFDYAWLHHIHNNCHHWQYWLLQEDEGKMKALKMPPECVYHMIADWWAFSWISGNLNEIFDWYETHKKKMILHESTRKLVENTLERIKTLITEEKPKEE